IQDVTPPPGPPGPAPRKTYQQITATGPGEIHLLDKATRKKTTHASWQDKLTSTKDGAEDLLVLTGAARFVGDKTEQPLPADVLKVGLEPAPDKEPAGAVPAPGTAQGRRPRHLEATGAVEARSKEMNIHHTSRLVVWFKDVPAEALLPEAAGGG